MQQPRMIDVNPQYTSMITPETQMKLLQQQQFLQTHALQQF